MFIASDRLECRIAGLDIDTLANTQISLLQAKTYVVCDVCKTWDWYGLRGVQQVRNQTVKREGLTGVD